MSITTTTEARGSKASQVINGKEEPSRKWFNLHNNQLDGSFYPIPAYYALKFDNEEPEPEEEERVDFGDVGDYAHYKAKVIFKPYQISGGGDWDSYGFTLIGTSNDYALWLLHREGEIRIFPHTSSTSYYFDTEGANIEIGKQSKVEVESKLNDYVKVWVDDELLLEEVSGDKNNWGTAHLGVLRPDRGITFYGEISHAEIYDMDKEEYVGYWPMNEGSGDTVEDKAGDNDGTIYGATWKDEEEAEITHGEQVGFWGNKLSDSEGKVQEDVLEFDETDDYVEIATPVELGDKGKIEINIYFASTGDYRFAVLGTASNPADRRCEIAESNGNWSCGLGDKNYRDLETNTAVTTGEWHRVVLEWDNGSYSLTVNGTEVGSGSYGGAVETSNIDWDIGGDFVGKIASLKTYSNSTLAGDWPMNEGSGDTIEDKAGDNDGTIYGASWSRDYVLPENITWELDEEKTISALRLIGDGLLDSTPVDFDIELYDSGDNLLHTEEVRGNDKVKWRKILPQDYTIKKQVVKVYKVSPLSSNTVKILETSDPVGIRSEDSLSILSEEISDLSIGVFSFDSLSVALQEEVEPITAKLSAQDFIAVGMEEQKKITVYLPKATDVLAVALAEERHITALLASLDELKISELIEATDVTVEFASEDTLTTQLQEQTYMTNIHTVMDAPVRQIYGMVEITYTDPLLDETIEVNASGTAHGSDPKQVTNNIEEPAQKWFSLHNNILDGSFRLLDNRSVGWWSDVLSDSNGEFTEPPKIWVEFEPRSIFRLKVIGDSKLNNYPVDFKIHLYDEADSLLHTEEVTDNDQVEWNKEIDPVTDVAKQELEVEKISQGEATAKILEFYTALVETYQGEDLFSINLLEESEFSEGTIPIGNISSNELSISLNNIDRRFSPENPESPLQGMLLKNRRVRAWLGAEVEEGEIEWYQLGKFWTREWDVPENDTYASTDALDRLDFLQDTEFSTSEVYEGKSLKWLAKLILDDAEVAEVPEDKYHIDDDLDNIHIPYAWFEPKSHRSALKEIAKAGMAQVYCDREGIVRVEKFKPTEKPMFEFSRDNYFSKDHPLAWGEISNHVTVKAKPRRPTEEKLIYEDEDEFTVEAGEEVENTYFFDHEPCIDIQEPVITAGDDISVKDYDAYSWGIRVTFENTGTSDQEITKIEVYGKELRTAGGKTVTRKDEQSIRDNGKKAIEIESEFIQTQDRAEEIAEEILATFKDPRRDISLDARGNVALQLGYRVTAPDYLDQVISEYFVKRQELEWDGTLSASIDLQRVGDE